MHDGTWIACRVWLRASRYEPQRVLEKYSDWAMSNDEVRCHHRPVRSLHAGEAGPCATSPLGTPGRDRRVRRDRAWADTPPQVGLAVSLRGDPDPSPAWCRSSSIRPRVSATATSCACECTSSLCIALRTCVLTVASLINSSSAISRRRRPSATRDFPLAWRQPRSAGIAGGRTAAHRARAQVEEHA